MGKKRFGLTPAPSVSDKCQSASLIETKVRTNGSFAQTDADAAHSLVSDTKDTLTVRHNDQINVILAAMRRQILQHAIPVGVRNVAAFWSSKQMRVFLYRLSDSGRVNDS